VHDSDHGEDMIFAAARYGDGLPANVIPIAVNEVTAVGLEVILAGFAYGAAGLWFSLRGKPKHDVSSLHTTIDTARSLLRNLGFGDGIVGSIETDDPDVLVQDIRSAQRATVIAKPASFMPVGSKRDVLTLAMRELHRAAPTPVDVVAMPAGAPFGRVLVDSDGCTLCLACVSACPTSALTASQDKPQLLFDESLCVQCGLCQATCPEKVITLEPRVAFDAFSAGAVVLKEEEPFCCSRCAKPFGVKSTVERIVKKLEGQHWMFSGDNAARLDLIKMCDTCRIEVATNENLNPYAGPARPAPKTSDDYLREREAAMLAKIKSGEA
jgi:ferredoxin